MKPPPQRSTGGKVPIATRIIRDTLRQGGKIDEEVFKKIVRARLSEKMANSSAGYGNQPTMFASSKKVKRSEKAQKALDMMKAVNEEKAKRKERQEVVVIARRYPNGKIDAKGNIYDLAGNPVARVNRKDGSMTTVSGQYFGKYRSKSFSVDSIIIDMINKHSPYFINQRMALLKQRQAEDEAARQNMFSFTSGSSDDSRQVFDVWGNDKGSASLGDVWGNRKTDVWGNPVW